MTSASLLVSVKFKLISLTKFIKEQGGNQNARGKNNYL